MTTRLTILREVEHVKGRKALVICQCSCGQTTVKDSYQVRTGQVRSCGNCKRVRGRSNTPEYNAWRDAVARCTKPGHVAWKHYGGRGIMVWDGWLNDFESFLRHIGPRPSPELTLERINNEHGYVPGNVKWATRSEQARNTRRRVRTRQPLFYDI